MKFRLMFIIIPIMMFIGCDTECSRNGSEAKGSQEDNTALVVSAEVIKLYPGYFDIACYDKPIDDESKDSVDYSVWKELSYLWRISDNTADGWQDLSADGQSHKIESGEIGKYIQVVITQVHQDKVVAKITTAPVLIRNCIGLVTLNYNSVLNVGDKPTINDITGVAVDMFDVTVDGLSFSFYGTPAEMYFSRNIWLDISSKNFEKVVSPVFVTVQAKLTQEELPSLSTDTDSIPVGKVQFETNNAELEVSVDGGNTYNVMTGLFSAAAGDILYIRKKAIGTPGENNYRKESTPLTVTVNEANVGKRTEGSGLIDNEISVPKLTLTGDESADKIYITPSVEIADSEILTFSYNWYIDFVPISGYEDVTEDAAHRLIIDKSILAADVYQIYCETDVVYDENKLFTLSAQCTVDNRE
ncbi:MAG: hypothetical protein IKN25_07495 [Spirochaetales bacterium]|nr:hypothetical protein [Spirochaetales bacterium]